MSVPSEERKSEELQEDNWEWTDDSSWEVKEKKTTLASKEKIWMKSVIESNSNK